jgi:hypothetical protein
VLVATDRIKDKILVVQISLSDLNALVDVLKTCADDFCGNRNKNALDLRIQYLRMSALRDSLLEPAHEQEDDVVDTVVVDPARIPRRPPERKDW